MTARLANTIAVVESGIRDGLHRGAQLYVSRDGQMIGDIALGASRLDGTPMASDTLNLWMSSVKPVAAVAVAQLRERGLLDFDDPVARFVPEFGVNGKSPITLRHLLTHTGGFRMGPTNWVDDSWEQVVARVCAAPLEPRWVPGEKAGYHPSSAWVMLGEIVRRVDPSQRSYDRYVREEIFLPLRMNDSWCGGMPLETYRGYGARIGAMFDTTKGIPSVNEANHGVPTERAVALNRPGANGRGPIRELGRFYEMLMNGGSLDDSRILSRESVAELTRPQRVNMFDHTFKYVIDWGLGFILNSNDEHREKIPYSYGRHASAATFGHSGAQSSCAFCDPATRLVVASVCNGMPTDDMHQSRQRAINEAVYEDVLRDKRGADSQKF
jgi:CubicO group peptidase (beta-lactamase class C family)